MTDEELEKVFLDEIESVDWSSSSGIAERMAAGLRAVAKAAREETIDELAVKSSDLNDIMAENDYLQSRRVGP